MRPPALESLPPSPPHFPGHAPRRNNSHASARLRLYRRPPLHPPNAIHTSHAHVHAKHDPSTAQNVVHKNHARAVLTDCGEACMVAKDEAIAVSGVLIEPPGASAKPINTSRDNLVRRRAWNRNNEQSPTPLTTCRAPHTHTHRLMKQRSVGALSPSRKRRAVIMTSCREIPAVSDAISHSAERSTAGGVDLAVEAED